MEIGMKEVEQLQTVLRSDDNGVTFTVKGDVGRWWLTGTSVAYFDSDKDDAPYRNLELADFALSIKGKPIHASVFLQWVGGKAENAEFDEWEALAKYFGVTNLVVLSTKVPRVVAKRFAVLAPTETPSQQLRALVYAYVKQQLAEQAEELMFRPHI